MQIRQFLNGNYITANHYINVYHESNTVFLMYINSYKSQKPSNEINTIVIPNDIDEEIEVQKG